MCLDIGPEMLLGYFGLALWLVSPLAWAQQHTTELAHVGILGLVYGVPWIPGFPGHR